MNPDVVIEALVETARRRGLLNRSPGKRLARYAKDHHVQTLADMRAWLAKADGINADLAKRLTTDANGQHVVAGVAKDFLAHVLGGYAVVSKQDREGHVEVPEWIDSGGNN